MDAASDRTAKAQGRKLVNTGAQVSVSVAEGYERWAPTYDDAPNPLLAREQRQLLPLLTDLHSKHILDLACGTGRWLETLMRQGREFGVGIDCSIAMLRVAAKKSCITGRLARGTCDHLPFRAGVFDLAICSFALGHVEDLRSTVFELARVTKPQADIFVSDLHPEAYARGWRVGFRDRHEAFEIETLPREAEEIARVFCANGFESLANMALYLGEPEKPIFARAGKEQLFAEACQSPAILVCHFKRGSGHFTQSSALRSLSREALQ
jgi:ubiquinone/menaquinone biosynthesis C-methylase UbiE